jgi:lysophospholipid acyltransferase (LPLAT)-like uncharacterized protein
VDLRTRAVTGLGGGLLTALMRTVRFEVLEGAHHYAQVRAPGASAVLLVWHGRLLPVAYYHRHQEIASLISQNRDGEYIARVVQDWWGIRPIRGSSSRGGKEALRKMIRTLREGTSVAITPDGPRGPRQKFKAGALLAAQLANVPLLPGSASANRAWWFGTWDRFQVPKPFSRVRIIYGEPIFVARDADAARLQATADRLEDEMNRLTAAVDRSWELER